MVKTFTKKIKWSALTVVLLLFMGSMVNLWGQTCPDMLPNPISGPSVNDPAFLVGQSFSFKPADFGGPCNCSGGDNCSIVTINPADFGIDPECSVARVSGTAANGGWQFMVGGQCPGVEVSNNQELDIRVDVSSGLGFITLCKQARGEVKISDFSVDACCPEACDDGDCNTNDGFDFATCSCVFTPIPPPNCDDNDCTTDDSYNAATCTCVNTPITPPNCDDGDCNTADVYNTTTCMCENTPITGTPNCDDGDCSTTDSYDVASCTCIHTPITPPNCDDGDCNTADVYNTATCMCENTPITGTPNCDDGDCSTTDSYNTTTCKCENVPFVVDCAPGFKFNPATCNCDQECVADSDWDGTPDCFDACPLDASKTRPGACGCGKTEEDWDMDGDGVIDCLDVCPMNPYKQTSAGVCGCEFNPADETRDSDKDGIPDCKDACPVNSYQASNSACGCEAPQINNVLVYNIRACDPKTNTFTADIAVYFDYPPELGGINFRGDLNFYHNFENYNTKKVLVFPYRTFIADGGSIDFIVEYKGNEGCNYTAVNVGTAPAACKNVVIPVPVSDSNNGVTDPKDDTPVTVSGGGTAVDPNDIIPVAGGGNTSTTGTSVGTTSPVVIDASGGNNCGIDFIGIENVRRCSDNRTRFKTSDDYFECDVMIKYNNPPSQGMLKMTGASDAWIDVRHMAGKNRYMMQGVRLPADGKPFELGCAFSHGNQCAHVQQFEGISLKGGNSCNSCNVMSMRVMNMHCSGDIMTFDLMVTGSHTASTYKLNGATGAYTGTYNQLSRFTCPAKGNLTMEIIDDHDASCRMPFAVNSFACASGRSNGKASAGFTLNNFLNYAPNPAQNELLVDFNIPDHRDISNTHLVIYDLLGKKQLERRVNNHRAKTYLDISSLQNGVYMITLNMDGLLYTGKLVKENWK